MTTGFSAPDFPFAKIPTEEIARKMLDQYPQWSGMLRTTGEGSQDFNFYDSQDRAYIDGFLQLAKYLDVPVIVVLNGYWELMHHKYGSYQTQSEIARKSNLGIVNEVIRSGVKVYAWAISNEIYAKVELVDWSLNFLGKPDWSRNTTANITNMNKAVDRYMIQVWDYEYEIGKDYKYALPMATDLNLARKTWDTRIFGHIQHHPNFILDAHIYPSRTLTQLGLETLIKKRLGRGYSTGAEIICGEVNLDFGMYGTGTIDPYARSAKHLAQLQAVLTEIGKYAKAACVHKLGSIQPNNYSMIQFTI